MLEDGSAADTLMLRDNGRSSGEPRVVLSDFQPTRQGNRAPGTSAIRGHWSTYAKRKRGGRIILEADKVHDIAYVRQAGER